MHRLMFLLGVGTALLAAGACRIEPETPLAAAAVRDDPDAIRRLIKEGQPVDDLRGAWTPLMWAARAGATRAISALLDAGADVNMHDRRSAWTPLLHAIHTKQTAAIVLLLERGADPNARSSASGGTTP